MTPVPIKSAPKGLAPLVALDSYRSTLRCAYLDSTGLEQHMIVQSTLSTAGWVADKAVVRQAFETLVATLGGELLSLQLAVESYVPAGRPVGKPKLSGVVVAMKRRRTDWPQS